MVYPEDSGNFMKYQNVPSPVYLNIDSCRLTVFFLKTFF